VWWCVFSADYLYICHDHLEVCKLQSCSESLLVLAKLEEDLSTLATLNLVVNPVKRFVGSACD